MIQNLKGNLSKCWKSIKDFGGLQSKSYLSIKNLVLIIA